jgi:uroporphyrinogen decarboxylase
MIPASDLMLRTLKGEATKVKPVWLMRQAGRYLPEYRAVRSHFPAFTDFYKDSDAATEVTLQPLYRFKLDAAILFSDILTLLPPMGFDLNFVSGTGPVIGNPLRTMQDFEPLKHPKMESELYFVGEAIGKIQRKLDGKIPLLGFAGGPLTVASYALEGGSSRELLKTKTMLFQQPELFHRFLDFITNITFDYLMYQAHCGVDALVVMDSWAGFFSPEDYATHIFPYTQRLFNLLQQANKPLLHYANGAGHLLPHITRLPAQAIGVDWRVNLQSLCETYPNNVFQGNLDPMALHASPKVVQQKTSEILEVVQHRPHIMNLGHGAVPTTPVDCVHAFINTIRGKAQ